LKAIQNFFIKYRHAWVFLYGLIYLPWFGWLEKHVTSDFHVIHMAIDDSIPFIEYFVIPYFLWFAYIAVSITYFFFQDKKDFYKLCIFLFTGMTIFLIVSTIYPNGHHLRPEQFYHENIFTKMTAWLYKADTPTNLFPSIHVYNSLGVHFAITKSESLRNKKRIKALSFILCTSIILSTMFLKQHSFFDVITAFAMAAVLYGLIYVKTTREQKSFKKQLRRI